jgi:serine/threonine protein kinase
MNSTPETTLPLAPWPFLAPPEAKDEIGRLAGYRVLKLLGKGGMGMVFQAEDPQLRRLVALKVMLPDVAAGEQSRERFLREARAAAKLKHDHVVTIYQVGEDRGVPFLAMEFLKGKSLADWLSSGKRPTVGETLLIGRQIAKGLAAAHQAGLVHRDIKPANLWLEAPAGRVKILDFGLARTNERDVSLMTEQGAVVGTPAFMAPEQARGETVTPRSDLFSLGCVLYRLAAGRPPFTGDSLVAVLSAVLSQTPRNVRELNSDVPEPLAVLIERLLAKDLHQRPGSAQEVQEELAAISRELKSTGDTARFAAETLVLDSPSMQRPRERTQSWKKWLAGAALLVVVGVIGTTLVANFLLPRRNTIIVHPQPVKPSPQRTEPEVADSIDLGALIELERDGRGGRWGRPDGVLTVGQKGDPARFAVIIPWIPPDEYRLHVTAEHVAGKIEPLVFGLSSGEHRFNLLVDSANGEAHLTGLGLVDGRSIAERADRWRGKVLSRGIPIDLVVTVRKDSIALTASRKTIYEWQGDLGRTSRPPRQPDNPLSILGTGPGALRLHKVVLEPLGSDRGQPLYPAEMSDTKADP